MPFRDDRAIAAADMIKASLHGTVTMIHYDS